MIDLDPEVLEVLACPNCHSSFAVDPERSELVCTGTGCGLAFPVEGRIPILLVDEARPARSSGSSPA
ncbi:Trm112 family protein [Granulicoccus sp. GXG6511]|uniref:Trm112 family protein n=1 Tax=Granulicoccus sp. GXG6511 TaxID=3381351 RepID=UPI003D7EE09A